jgi:hypothetical protein
MARNNHRTEGITGVVAGTAGPDTPRLPRPAWLVDGASRPVTPRRMSDKVAAMAKFKVVLERTDTITKQAEIMIEAASADQARKQILNDLDV